MISPTLEALRAAWPRLRRQQQKEAYATLSDRAKRIIEQDVIEAGASTD